jgi:hypothetical protein
MCCQFYHLVASNPGIPEHFMVADILFEILGIPFARNHNQISHFHGRYLSIENSVSFLSSILGPGGECHGYALRFVGHSLGGAIGALAGIMLHKRYSNLHVYAYGVLPCVDAVVADACSSFVTSIEIC